MTGLSSAIFEAAMIKLGFHRLWVKMVMRLVTTVSFQVLFNGGKLRQFTPSRGVRQGDPFSPFLFNMPVENLAKMIRQAQSAGLLEGLVPHLINKGIDILQYADDTILLIQDVVSQAVHLKLILYLFEAMSGLKINFSKSEVLIVMDDSEKGLMYADMFGC